MVIKTSEDEFDRLLSLTELNNIEFKSAHGGFSPRGDKGVFDYCCALANEEGGRLILGVEDGTKRLTNTNAFSDDWNTLEHLIFEQLRIRVPVEELHKDGQRVLIFHIPKHNTASPVMYNGRYRTRRGESIGNMTPEELQMIFAEKITDYSSDCIPGLTLDDLDIDALAIFRELRVKKAEQKRLKNISIETLLEDVGLIKSGQYTRACLLLLGKEEKIKEIAPHFEIIYEWRQVDTQVHYDSRVSWKQPYLLIYNDVWSTINARNIQTPFQEGFIQRTIEAFDEDVCREAVNNAVAHRDYSIKTGAIFIHASPQKISVTSPGGFLPGITPENIAYKSEWRNKLIAEVMEQTKLVERSGQGIDDIFEISIKQGKGKPDFYGTDDYTVVINIPVLVQDIHFVKFLEEVYGEKQVLITFDELLELEHIRTEHRVHTMDFKDKFLRLGLIEKMGNTSGMTYMLSRRYYEHKGNIGEYSGIRGLSRQSKKQLILEHIERNGTAHTQEFIEAFPDLKKKDVSNFLQELRRAEKIIFVGVIGSKNSRWKLAGSS